MPAPAHPPDLATQLRNMGVVAVTIERSVEIYLGLTRLNGAERASSAAEGDRPPATRVAASAAVVLGLGTVVARPRILPSLGLGHEPDLQLLINALRAGIDVTLSGALIGDAR